MTERKLFRFHWRGGGPPNEGWGTDAADAANRLGIGAGAIAALDYWEVVPTDPPPAGDSGHE